MDSTNIASLTKCVHRVLAGCALMVLGIAGSPAWGWTCPQTVSTPSCGLWQSPNDNNEVLDQASLGDTVVGWAQPKIGQTFKVGGNGNKTLYRLDLILGNNESQLSGVLKIWTWKNTYAQTVATTPIFNEAVDLTGREKHQLKSFYPRITVKGGTTYLFELDGTGRDPFRVIGGTIPYANGEVYENGATNTYDLWFRTFLPPSGSPILPTFAASDPPQWTAPLTNSTPVTKEDYYARVKNLAENQRCDGLYGCGASSKQDALYEAFLYSTCQAHSDCGTDHLGYAVTMLKQAERWFRCSPAPVDDCNCIGCGPSACGTCTPGETYFGSMEKAGLAYLWLQPAWSSISQADHIQIRNMFLDNARNLWSQRELGTHNRAFAFAVTYRTVLTIAAMSDPYPGMPDPTPTETADWEAYASGVWDALWITNNRDAEEDSEGYVMLEFFRYVLEYTSIAGLEATVWQDPAFLAWVERIYNQFTPLGVAPDYGHGGGWAAQNSGPIWLFETAAAMTGQTKYKWLAHRIFEHTRDRVCDCAPPCPWSPPPGGCPASCTVHNPWIIGDAYANDMASIAGAYLAADDGILDTQPGAQVEWPGSYMVKDGTALWTGTPAAPVGQTFRIADSPLVRLELKVADNGGNVSNGTINVWKWNAAGYSATVSQTPLYRDVVKMDDASLGTTQGFYPFLAGLNTADTFFFEVSRAAAFGLSGSAGTNDWYPDGQLRVNGAFSTTADLWFRSFTLGKNGSTFTTRQHWVQRPYSQWGSPPKYIDIQPGVFVPDKLTLRSGYDKNAMHAVFNLVIGYYGHGELEPAALASLVDDGSVIMTETAFPYWQYAYQDEDESMAMVRRYWGGTNGPRGDRTSVSHFGDYRKASVAWVDWNDIHGWQIAQQRRIYFVKDRFMLVRDRYRFPNAMRAAVGPVWHLADVHPTHGTNWYDVYNRQPVGNVFEVRNPERYALLYFVDRANYSVAEFREPNYLPGPSCPVQPVQACEVLSSSYTKPADCRNSPPYIAYQRRVLDSTTNQNVWFDTLLWPHGYALRPDGPTPAASKVTKKFDDGSAVALEVRVPVGGSPDEVWTVVDNPNRITLTASSGDLLTDARYLVSRRTAGDPASNYLLAKEATRVRVGTTSDPERIDYTWTVANTVELGGNYPPCPPVTSCPNQYCLGGQGLTPCDHANGECTTGSDTGLQICQGTDEALECPVGQTIHTLSCPCECQGQSCGSWTTYNCQ
jgi:hypothetical protein